MPRATSNRRTWRPKIILASITVLGCLVIVELILESLRPTAAQTTVIKRSIRLKEHHPTSSTMRERPSAFLQNCADPVKKLVPVRIDAEGFIAPSRVHQNAELEIVFLGGSTTECLFVDEETRWPYLAGRRLEESLSVAVNSYNAGGPGNHSMHSNHILLAKLLPKDPDMVVLMHCVNDLKYLTYTGSYWSNYDDRLLKRAIIVTTRRNRERADVFAPWAGVKQLMNHTFPEVYQRALNIKRKLTSPANKSSKSADEWEQFRHRPLKYDLDAISQQFAQSLTIFCTTCRAYEIEPVLMTQAHRGTAPTSDILQLWKVATAGMNYDFEKFVQHYVRFNNVIRQVATEQQALLIDLEKQVPPKPEFMYDLVHFNNRGSRLVAQIITDQLEPQLKEKHNLSEPPVSLTFQEHTIADRSDTK